MPCWRANTSFSARPSTECEQLLAPYCGCAHAVGVSSGSDALLVGADGRRDRPGRRGDHDAVHVFRHRRGHRPRCAPRRSSSTSARRPTTSIRRKWRRRVTATHQGDHSRSPLRAVRRDGPDPGGGRASQAGGDRGCGPGHRRRVQGPPRRLDGRVRLLQLLPLEESRRRRRRRPGDARGMPSGRKSSACCACTARSPNTTTA